MGHLSNGAAARHLLAPTDWSAIYGPRHPVTDDATLLPPFVSGVNARELLWEFQFKALTEMACPVQALKRVYSMTLESNFWEEARWLSDEVFNPRGLTRRHPYIDVDLMRAVISAPSSAFRRAPVLKEFQRSALRDFLAPEIAKRHGGAEQTANVMFNYAASVADFTRVIQRCGLGSNHLIDTDRLRTWYIQGLEPTAVYPGGSIDFDHLWATIHYDRWLTDWRETSHAH